MPTQKSILEYHRQSILKAQNFFFLCFCGIIWSISVAMIIWSVTRLPQIKAPWVSKICIPNRARMRLTKILDRILHCTLHKLIGRNSVNFVMPSFLGMRVICVSFTWPPSHYWKRKNGLIEWLMDWLNNLRLDQRLVYLENICIDTICTGLYFFPMENTSLHSNGSG